MNQKVVQKVVLKVAKEKVEEIYKKIYDSNNNLVLTGMPGSGKSTIGKILAERLGRTFVDTDALIVEREKREISDIFKTDGEKYFRNVEKEVIESLSSAKNSIISTGGGAVLNEENVKNLMANGTVFFLDRYPDDLIPTSDRPLADEKAKIMKLYEERLPIYNSACDVKIIVDKGIEETVNEVLNAYENMR